MQDISSLKTLYTVQMILGFFSTIFVTFFVAIMSTDAPSSTSSDAILGGFIGFSLTFGSTVILPLLATNELDTYPDRKKLFFNYVESLFLLFTLFPVGLWQAYVLFSLKKPKTHQEHTLPKVTYTTKDTSSMRAVYIVLGIILFFTASYYLEKYSKKDREVILDCGDDYISTRMFSSTKLYFNNKAAVYLTPHNAHNLGILDGNIIRVTNPYLNSKEIDILRSCIEQNGTYKLDLPSSSKTK
jgi:hypothetical protein